MKRIYKGAAVMALALSMTVPALAAMPDVNVSRIRIKGENDNSVKEASSYLYSGHNYYKLRDMGKILGFGVEWDEQTGNIVIQRDENAKGEISEAYGKAEKVITSKQRLICNGVNAVETECLNIDGYNYFKIRDLADILGFGCDWDEEANEILISFDEKEAETAMSAPVKATYINSDTEQSVTDGKGIYYKSGSGDYSEIEKYIRENINADFEAKDFIINEYEGIYSAVNIVDMRYSVKGIPAKNYGYRVICENGYAKIINSIGKLNPDFDINSIADMLITDEEAKQNAVENHSGDDMVINQTVSRYFDMDILKFVCEVETEYEDKGGATVVIADKYYN